MGEHDSCFCSKTSELMRRSEHAEKSTDSGEYCITHPESPTVWLHQIQRGRVNIWRALTTLQWNSDDSWGNLSNFLDSAFVRLPISRLTIMLLHDVSEVINWNSRHHIYVLIKKNKIYDTCLSISTDSVGLLVFITLLICSKWSDWYHLQTLHVQLIKSSKYNVVRRKYNSILSIYFQQNSSKYILGAKG